jgi:predicted GNAT family acetyltransferase
MSITASVPSRARSGWVRQINQSDFDKAAELARNDPYVNAFALSRIEAGRKDLWRVGGAIWGYFTGVGLESMLFVGANIVPVGTTESARVSFAHELIQSGRRSSSMLGAQSEVLDLWNRISHVWGKPREIRETQPFLVLTHRATGKRDSRVRLVMPEELEALLPASIKMFTEEVGISPIANGGLEQYRRRVSEVISEKRAFAIFENGHVIFKAEVGFATANVAQIQGVWISPELRGSGLAKAAMARVVDFVQAEIAPVVTLYVNDFNIPAHRTYTGVGFRQHEIFSTVLF